jgi:hypothetical protein
MSHHGTQALLESVSENICQHHIRCLEEEGCKCWCSMWTTHSSAISLVFDTMDITSFILFSASSTKNQERKVKEKSLGLWVTVHTYNPSYAGGGTKRIAVQGWIGQKQETLHEKETENKGTKGLGCVVQARTKWGPEFNPQYYKKKIR